MERLWSPWRARYIASGVDAEKDGCVFCAIASDPEHDEENFVLHRAQHCFVVLNLYPYITGHLMIVPYFKPGKELKELINDDNPGSPTSTANTSRSIGDDTRQPPVL